jgi:long-chain acyl-CoA synthetase
LGEGEQEEMNVPDLVQRALNWPDRVFIISGERLITNNQLHHQTIKVANVLRQAGVEKGDKVSLLLPNTPEFAFCFFGAQMLGGVPNPLNTRLNPREIVEILAQVQPKVLVATPQYYTAIRDQAPTLSCLKRVFLIGDNVGAGSLENAMAQAPSTLNPQLVDESDAALLLYTSGTAGQPKGVLHSHGGLCYMLEVALRDFEVTADDNFLCVMPLYYAFGLAVNLLAPLMANARVTLAERFAPDLFWQYVTEHNCTVFAGAPTMYVALLRVPASLSPGITSLKLGISGGSALAHEVKQEFWDRFGCQIVEAYGTTEAFISHILPFGETHRSGCIGKVLDDPLYKADIVDESDQSVPPNEIGELIIHPPSVMQGYYDNPEGTAQAIKNGWFHTGDIGFRDEDGYFYLVGRKQDMIKRGGERISPQEVEAVLNRHPNILEAAVVGASDQLWGQKVKAFVVVKPGHSLSEEEIIAFCRRDLAHYKCPQLVEFAESLPKDTMGKVNRRLLLQKTSGQR